MSEKEIVNMIQISIVKIKMLLKQYKKKIQILVLFFEISHTPKF